MKIQIENLRAQMSGVQLNAYQRALALDEYYKLLDYVNELEQLTIPVVVVPKGTVCGYVYCEKPTVDIDKKWCEYHDKQINM